MQLWYSSRFDHVERYYSGAYTVHVWLGVGLTTSVSVDGQEFCGLKRR